MREQRNSAVSALLSLNSAVMLCVHLITSYTAEEHGLLFYEVSSKCGTNVEEAFTALVAGRVAFVCCWSDFC